MDTPKPMTKLACDCGHDYFDHDARPVDDAYCGGLDCLICGPGICASFRNDLTRAIEDSHDDRR